jgi:hypothetical protein
MIDKAFLEQYVTPGDGKCYICGPDAMLEDVAEALKSIGVDVGDIVTESFD